VLLAPADPRLACIAPQPVARDRPELRLDRFPPEVAKLLAGQIGPLANLRSSTGCGLQLATDSPWVTLHLDRLRHHQPIPQGVALEVRQPDGTWFASESPDLREREGVVPVRLATGLRPGEVRDCILWLPPLSTCAIAGVEVAEGSAVAASAPAAPAWLAIGDSLTQGFSTQSPLSTWVHRLSRRWNLPAWNLGVGGIAIEPEAFAWAVQAQPWQLVTIALGSNNGWRESTVATAADQCSRLVELALAARPGQLAWCLPPWKPMEEGKGPPEFMGIPLDRATGARMAQVRDALRERLAQYPTVAVIDDVLPHDHRWYPDGLHPHAWGFARYAAGVAAVLEPRLLA
jgi:lysophospholipase L1-like esterase